MTIETKFALGDKVWGIQIGQNGWELRWRGGWATICSIEVEAVLKKVLPRCAYGCVGLNRFYPARKCFETTLFSTASEAQAECDRRNKESGK